MDETNPTARALVCLELLQASPGITAERLGERLGVSGRAARRYVAVLREAGVPVESERGRYGGYRVGRGHRVPPLMFTTTEALALVMAVLEGDHAAADADDPVGSALGKIIRALPAPVAEPADAVRRIGAARRAHEDTTPDPQTTVQVVEACAAGRRLRLGYRTGAGHDRELDVDPWGVVTRHGRWYVLCWSHPSAARPAGGRRVLRLDRVVRVEPLGQTFTPPDDLDPVREVEEHLSDGWTHQVEVVVDAPAASVASWIPRSLGRLEPLDDDRTRLVGSTDEPLWYAQQLALLQASFRVVGPAEVQDAVRFIGQNLVRAGGAGVAG
ncbi:helix-turn-helix transcriptional regulator [Nocardioides sp. MAHUQ-72]|uniref:helix-turn-helix transcriptional regulator n=1 Tax=unclassified Nocardioides TaxID=2615069 RepID=UPI00361BAE03